VIMFQMNSTGIMLYSITNHQISRTAFPLQSLVQST